MEKKDIVFPGEFLSVEEEYSAGKNTFEKNGRIYSSIAGFPEFDPKKREVFVKKSGSEVEAVSEGSTVTGKVALVKENMVLLELIDAEKDGRQQKLIQYSATIMISRVSSLFVKMLSQEFKVGDFVRASVVEVNKYGIELSTSGPGFGVIKAFCSQCRQPLHLFEKNLKCLACGNTERRKLSKDYLLK